MIDHETHPVGTAARIAGKTIADWIEFARRDDCLDDMVPSDLRQVISALTRANAATAAAYEVAARRVEREGHSLGDEIRALATPDLAAALDKLIAKAEARAVKKTAAMVRTWRNTTPMTGEECADAILAVSKKGGV